MTRKSEARGMTEVQDVPLAQLSPWERNPRRISTPALERRKQSLEASPEMLPALPFTLTLPYRTLLVNAGTARIHRYSMRRSGLSRHG
jgi:hypothetical protein